MQRRSSSTAKVTKQISKRTTSREPLMEGKTKIPSQGHPSLFRGKSLPCSSPVAFALMLQSNKHWPARSSWKPVMLENILETTISNLSSSGLMPQLVLAKTSNVAWKQCTPMPNKTGARPKMLVTSIWHALTGVGPDATRHRSKRDI